MAAYIKDALEQMEAMNLVDQAKIDSRKRGVMDGNAMDADSNATLNRIAEDAIAARKVAMDRMRGKM
ncbi:hypothetical protein [Caballeronia sp. M23-90]